MAKHGPFHEGRKVGRSNATPFKLFFLLILIVRNPWHSNLVMISSLFLKWSSFLMSVCKMNISLLFRPSASEVLEVGKSVRKVRKGKIKKNDDVLNTQVTAL
jgi:hypothetical protein